MFNVAVGDTRGEASMNLHVEHSTSSSLLDATLSNHAAHPFIEKQTKVVVKTERLDDLLGDRLDSLRREILLKIDVQGYEARVLRGATRVLDATTACIVEVSLTPLYDGQPTFWQITSMLSQAGFEYIGNLSQKYGRDGQVMWLDAVFKKSGHNQDRRS
jgi:FkbM family methyltransferase